MRDDYTNQRIRVGNTYIHKGIKTSITEKHNFYIDYNTDNTVLTIN